MHAASSQLRSTHYRRLLALAALSLSLSPFAPPCFAEMGADPRAASAAALAEEAKEKAAAAKVKTKPVFATAESLAEGLKNNAPPAELLDKAKLLVEKEPRNAQAHFLMAECLQRAGLYDLAIDQYRTSKELDPAAANMRLAKFNATMNGDDLEPAMKQYLEISTTFPNDKALLDLQSLLKKRWGSVENGWEFYLQVVAHRKRLKGINATRGWDLYVARDYAAALKYANADLAIDPADPELQALQGRVLLNLRDYARARVPLQLAFRKAPYDYNSARDLTKVYMACGLKVPAFKTSLFYLTEKPDDKARQELVLGLLKQLPRKEWQAEAKDAERYAILANRAGDFYMGFGNVLRLSGDHKAASEQYRLGATLDRRSISAQLAYAQDLQRQGAFSEALRAYDYAVRLDSSNKSAVAARERVRMRLQAQSNDLAAQFKNALRAGRRNAPATGAADSASATSP